MLVDLLTTLLYALKQRILGNGVTKEDVIFISPSGGSQHNEHTEDDGSRRGLLNVAELTYVMTG